MGAFAPSPLVDAALAAHVMREIIEPVLRGMRDDGPESNDYRGFLYAGLMLTCDGPKVIEFNVRFGDPEAQAVLPLVDADLPSLLAAAAEGRLEPSASSTPLSMSRDVSVAVVLASAGYPGAVRTGVPIDGLDEAAQVPGVEVFHAATAMKDDRLVTAGGRVLTVTGRGTTYADAIARAYEGVGKISFDGMQYRKDIGRKALQPLPAVR
jgi:phosphoribosylamine---glycine ligase